MGAVPATAGKAPYILNNYGSTSTTSGGGGGFLSDVLPAVGIASHFLKRGGGIERRDAGGATNDPSVNITVSDPSSGMSSANSWQAPLIQENLDAQMAASLTPPADASSSGMASGGMAKRAGGGAAEPTDDEIESWMQDRQRQHQDADLAFHNTYGQHITLPELLPLKPTSPTRHAQGGDVHRKHFDVGGFSSSMESPWWERADERQANDRHGLLASPIAGRTDKLAVNPATGSYVIPADVIAGLGEGNTLAGANVMQRIIETGPHGLRMPASRAVKGFPHPPPAYREGEGDNSMASGGGVPPHYASGGMSPAVSSYLANNGLGGSGLPSGNGTYTAVPFTGINASTGHGVSNTGIPELDAYLNSTEAGVWVPAQHAPVAATPAPAAAPAQTASDQPMPVLVNNFGNYADANPSTGGPMAQGGMVPKRDKGGSTNPDESDMTQPPVDASSGTLDMSGGNAGGGNGITVTPQDVPAQPLPEPPIPPSHPPASTRGMSPSDRGRAPSRGMQPSGPPSVDGPPPPPPPQDGMRNPDKPDKSDKFEQYLAKFQPSKPDPWLDLAIAGFATAAGRSPHALENIGAGAERGVLAYQQQKQEQAKEGLQAGETAARLSDTDAYRNGMLGYHDRSLDVKQAGQDALAQYRTLFLQQKAAGQSDTAAHQYAMEQLGYANLDARKQVQADRTTLGYANLAQRQQAQDAVAQYRDAMTKNRAMTAAETANWHAYMKSKGATDQDIRLATSMNTITGKPNFPDPHAGADKLRTENAQPDGQSPPPPTGTQPPLGQVLGIQ
jgi:hypothetical protein